jgi:iron(III) transport system ATP-binding protein
LRTEVRRILKRAGVTAIIVTHDREDAFDLADRIAVMREGRLEQVGTPREVHDTPATAFVARFVADACAVPGHPAPDGVMTELGLLPLAQAVPGDSGQIDVFLRPDQVLLEPSRRGNAIVVNACFRGDRSLATVRLASGLEIVATAPRTCRVVPNERVAVRVIEAPAAAIRSHLVEVN